ncbi:response regulator [Lacisediminihabitans sp. H27-G8]|uniref:response regulator n=1 Tax=Lacisediminihabitans sp. H27-G8 TaxID=3111909 RepID=UPI0038FC2F34
MSTSSTADPATVGTSGLLTPPDQLRDRLILVVDDDATVSEVVCSYLRSAGFQVESVADGGTAVETAARIRPDLVVLDRMLPGIDGVEVCRRIRAERAVPVIMLTALREEEDRIDGLEAGADDYLAKPFSPRELVLRVKSVLRRSLTEFSPEAPIDAGDFHLDVSSRQLTLRGEAVSLTIREFDLIAFLLRHPRQVFGREELLRAVWGWEFGDLSTVTVHVRRLREKIERDAAHPTVLNTVWGVGYRFDVEPAVTE